MYGHRVLDVGRGPVEALSLFVGPPRLVYRSGTSALRTCARMEVHEHVDHGPSGRADVLQFAPPAPVCGWHRPLPRPPAAGDTLVVLESTPAPPDAVGPLTIS